eukprot:jgi/Astpho2/609/Aster-x0028
MALLTVLAAALAAIAALVVFLLSGQQGKEHSAAQLFKDCSATPPWFIFRAATSLSTWLRMLPRKLEPAPIAILAELNGMMSSQVVFTVAELNVAGHLDVGWKTAKELTKFTGAANTETLERMMRAAHYLCGLFEIKKGPDGSPMYQNNALSAVLSDRHPNSVRAAAIHFNWDCWRPWGRYADVVRTGTTKFAEENGGLEPWAYFRANPKHEENFSQAMRNVDSLGAVPAVQDYPWERFRRVLDIGGATGSFLVTILKHHPRLTGVLFDQPQVIDNARGLWAKDSFYTAVADRVELVGGTFFNAGTIPKAKDTTDVFVMRVVLHDWNDVKAREILTEVRKAIGHSGATLVIMETSFTVLISVSI